MAESGAERLRWRLTDDDGGQPELFDGVTTVPGTRELAGLEFMHVRAKRVINRVPDGSRMPFRHTVNPYRGCSHACVYCFARPTHEYLNLDRDRDFDTRIVVKVNAVERVEAELASPRWGRELVALGTNTDPYQPCEGRYRLTAGIVAALTAAGNPFSIVTKSTLVLRDVDILAEAAERGLVHVDLSVGCLDRDVWRLTEPSTPSPGSPARDGGGAQPGGRALRGAGRADPPGHLRRPRSARPARRGMRRRRRRLDRRGRPASATGSA